MKWYSRATVLSPKPMLAGSARGRLCTRRRSRCLFREVAAFDWCAAGLHRASFPHRGELP